MIDYKRRELKNQIKILQRKISSVKLKIRKAEEIKNMIPIYAICDYLSYCQEIRRINRRLK